MPAEAKGQHNAHRCAFWEDGCTAAFADKKQLINHYVESDDHHYCEKCQVPCKDWEAFIDHKVKSPDHLCCPICGLDIRSGRSGLDLHHKQSHPREQRIVCKGCDKVFKRAGAYIEHFHRHMCKRITSVEVSNQTQHKVMVDQVLSKSANGPFSGGYHTGSTVAASDIGSTDRGSNSRRYSTTQSDLLTPSDVKSVESEFPPLQPSSQSTSSTRKPAWSSYQRQTGASNDSSIRNGSVADITAKTQSTSLLDTDTDADMKPTADSVASTRRGSNADGHERRPSIASSTAWSTARPPPAMPDPNTFAEGLYERNEEYDRSTGQRIHRNIGTVGSVVSSARTGKYSITQFWNPDSPGFDPERYYNQVIDRYDCPFPDCKFTCQYPTLLGDHLRFSGDHSIKKWPCPQCLKIFKSQHGLISHMESAFAKCKIRSRADYMAIMQRLSGGYVDASTGEREGEYKYEASRPDNYW